ncbi:fruit bromelain-like [Typha angustifolia]|uniref:fruit bromelain-like n=1 Tax=Typha angustifolia TaxID=59011 RepID=UPI003C2F3338
MARWYKEWMIKYGRAYLNDEEKLHRFEIFKNNAKYIEASNNISGRSYTLGLNQFADLTKEEFKATYLKLVRPNITESPLPFKYSSSSVPPPSSIDWRVKGAVTQIKSQGVCGSCWAFSAVAAIEGIFQIKNGTLLSLSEQELIDCVTEAQGCDGGHFGHAFEFVIENGGITTENNYPYMGFRGVCRSSRLKDHAANISSYDPVPRNDEASLTQAVANQPVSVGIDARNLQFYSSGIYDGPCGTNMDHAVTIVGYGRDYWIVKNSWGISWGEEGYILMQKGVVDPRGICGIAMDPYHPSIADPEKKPNRGSSTTTTTYHIALWIAMQVFALL